MVSLGCRAFCGELFPVDVNSGIRFNFGRGTAQIIDALAHQAGSGGVMLDVIINGLVAAVRLLFCNFARKGEKWAFIVGVALYAIDGLILRSRKDVLGVRSIAV